MNQVAARSSVRLKSWVLPALVALLLFLQLTSPYRGWWILLLGLGGAWLVSTLWARSLARGLHLTREMRFGWAQVGDHMIERFTVTNDGWAPALWFALEDHSNLPGYRTDRATSVGDRASIRWHSDAICARRGLFTLGPTTLHSGDPFGIYSVTRHYPASVPLLVLPPIVPLPAIEVAAGGRAAEGRPRPAALERTVSAATVREYTPGDSLRWIHWRTSAHRDSLYVRTFDGAPAGDWWIVLDMDRAVQVGSPPDTTEEHAVILAASLADRGLRAGKAVGLAAQGEHWVRLAPRDGAGQRWEILYALVLVSPGNCPLADLLAALRPTLGQPTSLIVITPAVDGAWLDALMGLMRGGATPTVFLLDPRSFGADAAPPERARSSLAELGVAHYVVTRDLLDRPEARPGHPAPWWVALDERSSSRRVARETMWKVVSG